tara:strand:- start:239 stop:676 length:438 start_codon:yes stop_codon:yes gene_type:complete
MKRIIIVNGPNLNLLGNREADIYGDTTLDDIKNNCIEKGKTLNLEVYFFQSNNEGEIINYIQEVNEKYDGLIINPAAFTHSSIAILDALRSLNKPKIEIHLSNIYAREEYRKKSVTSEGVDGLICGFGGNSYILGIEAIAKLIYN